jgi:hypothetical protein
MVKVYCQDGLALVVLIEHAARISLQSDPAFNEVCMKFPSEFLGQILH